MVSLTLQIKQKMQGSDSTGDDTQGYGQGKRTYACIDLYEHRLLSDCYPLSYGERV